MTNRIIFIGWFAVAVGFALCWYPLKYLKGMQMGSPQLLFYAFSSASLCTIPWLGNQVKLWQGHTDSLLAVGLSGSVVLTFLNFSLLGGEPLSVVSIFCLTLTAILLLKGVLSNQQLGVTEFLILLTNLLVSLVVLFVLQSTSQFHWSQFTAVLAGISCYKFFRYHSSSLAVPLASKLSAIFICSTWLVGMVIIFSPRLVSFPQENAVLISVLYGVLCLVPVLLAVLRVFQEQPERYLLLWVVLVLGVAILSVGSFESTVFDATRLGVIFSLIVIAYLLTIKAKQ